MPMPFTSWLNTWAHWVGYAVCHQMPEHSYITVLGPMPLCARCTGQYWGILLVLIFIGMRRRWRYRGWPIQRYPGIWGVLVLLWAVDGLNSFLDFLGLAHIYPPHNITRLVSGYLMGIVVGSHLWALFASLMWPRGNASPAVSMPADLPWVLLGGLVPLGGIALGGMVRWAVGIVAAGGVILSFTLLMAATLRALMRPEKGESPWPYLLGGTLLAAGFIAAVDWLRYHLS